MQKPMHSVSEPSSEGEEGSRGKKRALEGGSALAAFFPLIVEEQQDQEEEEDLFEIQVKIDDHSPGGLEDEDAGLYPPPDYSIAAAPGLSYTSLGTLEAHPLRRPRFATLFTGSKQPFFSFLLFFFCFFVFFFFCFF
jgi:hypothetical protein